MDVHIVLTGEVNLSPCIFQRFSIADSIFSGISKYQGQRSKKNNAENNKPQSRQGIIIQNCPETENKTMTLFRSAVAATLLLRAVDVANADSADTVSSRLQVHVRCKERKTPLAGAGRPEFRLSGLGFVNGLLLDVPASLT